MRGAPGRGRTSELLNVVLSVPHSGTRTLVASLGTVADGGILGNGMWWHFGADRHMRSVRARNYFAHIPIRHPLDVAKSWASRKRVGDVLNDFLRRYTTMFEYLADREAKLYRMEDLPRLVGMNEHAEGDHSRRIREFQDAAREHVIAPHRDFFAQYYEDLDRES